MASLCLNVFLTGAAIILGPGFATKIFDHPSLTPDLVSSHISVSRVCTCVVEQAHLIHCQPSHSSTHQHSVADHSTAPSCSREPLCISIVPAKCDERYVCGDRRLGPVHLPTGGVFESIFHGYEHFSSLHPSTYLKNFWDHLKKGWSYPDHQGFALMVKNGQPSPVSAELILPVGSKVDRFGSPWGSYLAPAGTPFGLRAIPMENLSDDERNPNAPPFNYYLYEVAKPFTVLVGPIAPHFGTPGYGLQYFTNITIDKTRNVKALVEEGFLKDITPLV
jgi:hypothetical protein